jgi:LPPG:FO 2-phospho-L-lactate transferase
MSFARVVALSGGVGGARLLEGLCQALAPGSLTAIVNTGDDFEHLGLYICPDLDTVMYTLADLGDPTRGWGLEGETFAAMAMVRRLGGPDWFSLGDRDLATHLMRTAALRAGESLTAITARLCDRLGVPARVLPMADAPCRTLVETADEGVLPFQEWFVARRARPAVRAVRFEGQPQAGPGVLAAIESCQLVIIGPSNPYVSIDPILSLEGVRRALAGKPVVAVSPIVGGRAVKGPLATMIQQLSGSPPGAAAIARHYGALLCGLVVERGDENELSGLHAPAAFARLRRQEALPTLGTGTVMRSREDRLVLASQVLAFAAELTQ